METNTIRLVRCVRTGISSSGPLLIMLFLAVYTSQGGAGFAAGPPLLDANPIRTAEGAHDVRAEARRNAERLRAERRAAAQKLAFDVPFYSIAEGFETTLILMNNTSTPISVDLAVRNDEGEQLALGHFVIEPLNHTEISLSRRLTGFEEEFATGSVRCELLGDAETLQGWAVVSEPDGHSTELPFSTHAEFESNRLLGFWDAARPGVDGRAEIDLYLLNTTDRPLQARIVEHGGDAGAASLVELGPRERLKLDTGAAGTRHRLSSGAVEIQHDGSPGAVRAVGLLTGRSTVRAWGFVDPVAVPPSAHTSPCHYGWPRMSERLTKQAVPLDPG